MNLRSGIEIAQNTEELPIKETVQKIDLQPEEIELYGNDKTKISWKGINCTKKNQKLGELILVTSTNPTPAGEGRSIVTTGLGDTIRNQFHRSTSVTLRRPSMGPVFGLKGGATGGGYTQIVPTEGTSLHFIGDMHALANAIDTLTALINNYIYQDNSLESDPNHILLEHGIDVNDRTLRKITIGQESRFDKTEHEASFTIAVANELVVILCLAADTNDLKKGIGSILVGSSARDGPIYVKDLESEGAVAALLSATLRPNLIQTLKHTPAIVHGGPFANIIHGANSVIATNTTSHLSGYVLTGADFSADLGGRELIDFVSNHLDKRPDAIIIVATVRILKYQVKESVDHLDEEDIPALEEEFASLKHHVENMAHYGVPVIVLTSKFASDTDQELNKLKKLIQDDGFECETVSYRDGGSRGGIQAAEKVAELISKASDFRSVYKPEDSVGNKIARIARKIYHAKDIGYSDTTKEQLAKTKKMNRDELSVVIAKTQCSFTDRKKILGVPEDFVLHVKDLALKGGAGSVVAATDSILDMPDLLKHPTALDVDVGDNGKISELF